MSYWQCTCGHIGSDGEYMMVANHPKCPKCGKEYPHGFIGHLTPISRSELPAPLVETNCPRCGKVMEMKIGKGETDGPNGGWLCVMEECAKVTELYDVHISMWKCGGCEQVVYLREDE